MLEIPVMMHISQLKSNGHLSPEPEGAVKMWLRVACVLLLGYLSVGRAFAYLGIPPWKVFVGEVALALFLLYGPSTGRGSWFRLSLNVPSLRRFWIWYGVFFAYGIIEVFHGIYAGYPPLTVIRDLAFNYYPLYFLLGFWAGLMRPDLLPRLIRGFAWFNGIYGLLFILFLNRVEWYLPGVDSEVAYVPIFGLPTYSFVALLGLLVYGKGIGQSWYLLLLNGFVMFGMQIRSEWVAFAIGVVVWLVLTRQGRQVVQAGAVLGFLIMLMYVTDFRLASPISRSEYDISARQLVDRALAPFRADVAEQKAAVGFEGDRKSTRLNSSHRL